VVSFSRIRAGFPAGIRVRVTVQTLAALSGHRNGATIPVMYAQCNDMQYKTGIDFRDVTRCDAREAAAMSHVATRPSREECADFSIAFLSLRPARARARKVFTTEFGSGLDDELLRVPHCAF